MERYITFFTVSMGVFLLAALTLLFPPSTRLGVQLRKILITAALIFGLANLWMTHTGLATMRRGDFWIFSAFGRDYLLPHPFDYALIYEFPKLVVEISLLGFLSCFGAYWLKRRA
jgi:hypothetical protein